MQEEAIKESLISTETLEFIEESGLEDSKRERLLTILRETPLPKNPIEAAKLCRAVDDIIEDEIANAKRTIKAKVRRVRTKHGKNLIKAARENKEWERFNWKTKESAVLNVKGYISIRLNIPQITPDSEDSEYTRIRDELLELSGPIMNDWSLAAAFGMSRPGTHFNTFAEMMVCIWGEEYGIKIEDYERYKFKWVGKNNEESKKLVLDNVREEVAKKLSIPGQAPAKDTEEWKSIRIKIMAISEPNFREWGISGSIASHSIYSSHIDIIVDIWGEEYDFKRSDFTRLLVWKGETDAETKDNVHRNVESMLGAHLNLQNAAPAKDSEEWVLEREKIIRCSTRNH